LEILIYVLKKRLFLNLFPQLIFQFLLSSWVFQFPKKEFALEAFELDVTDYILKQIEYARFLKAAQKALNIHNTLEHNQQANNEFFVKINQEMVKILLDEILFIEAYGDYVKVVTEEDSNLVLSTMKSFENDLSKDKFIRVHKSYIINIDKVERFNSKFAEIGVTKIPLSRNKKEDLIKALAIA
jgi:two-component system LytT family response regulator